MPAISAKETGRSGEAFARNYLEKKGYRVLAAGYRCSVGEIDFVCEEGGALVFVEVKTRRSPSAGAPEESVTPRKQRQLYRVAEWYLSEIGYHGERPCRFDVVSVIPSPEDHSFSAVLFRDAICL